MIYKELPTILDQNMMVEDGEPHRLTAIANRIEGNQKVWDAEIKDIFRCLQDMDVKIKANVPNGYSQLAWALPCLGGILQENDVTRGVDRYLRT